MGGEKKWNAIHNWTWLHTNVITINYIQVKIRYKKTNAPSTKASR